MLNKRIAISINYLLIIVCIIDCNRIHYILKPTESIYKIILKMYNRIMT